MDWNRTKFCQPIGGGGLTRENLVKDICTKLFFSGAEFEEILLERYRLMDVNKNTPVKNETISQWNQNGLSCVLESKRPDAYLPVPSGQVGTTDDGVRSLMQLGKFGFDLPVWVANQSECTRRIMLLTQDPRRVNDDIGMVTLSSPFGLHSQNCRLPRHKVGGAMARIVEMLCHEGSVVYLTDATKFFADDRGSCVIDARNTSFIDFLNIEIKYFRPTHIIAFGKIANLCLTMAKTFGQRSADMDLQQLYQGVQIQQMMHISLRNMHFVERAVEAFENHFIENIHNFVCGGTHD